MMRNNFGSNLEFLVLSTLLLAISSIPLSVVVLAAILRRGSTTVFEPSDSRVGWVEGPTDRGTMNLIWVCASTIYTCVYVSVHIDVLNVKQNSEDLIKDMKKTRLWKPVQTCFAAVWRQAARPSIRRAVWIVFNILAPGVVILVAILEVISAHDGMKFMHDCGQDDWNMTLAFYADMGGFAQETSEENHVAEDDEDKMVVRPFRNGQAFLKWYADQGRRFTKGQISRFKDEIHDRSDADSLLKLLTISQAAWFFVETMVRFAELRVVSQLEVATCAYIFCTTIAYCCWASKPYHIQGHIILPEHLKGPKTTTEESTDRPRLESRRTSTSTALNLEKGQPQLTPELPIMLFDKDVRFTPFNRSYRHPNRSWIRQSNFLFVVSTLTLCCAYSCVGGLRCRWCPGWRHSRSAPLECGVRQHPRSMAMAHRQHRAVCSSIGNSVQRIH